MRNKRVPGVFEEIDDSNFGIDDAEFDVDADIGILCADLPPVAAWRRLEQLREERMLRDYLREVYDD